MREPNSCAPQALAKLFDAEFEVVNDFLIQKGFRTPGSATRIPNKDMYEMGMVPFLFDLSWLTLSECPKSYPTGKYYIRIDGHALCMIDGIIYDSTQSDPKSIVKQIWKRIKEPDFLCI